jgi:hypothetical protein
MKKIAVALLALTVPASAQSLTTTISNLPRATTLTGAEFIPVVQSGATKKASLLNVVNLSGNVALLGSSNIGTFALLPGLSSSLTGDGSVMLAQRTSKTAAQIYSPIIPAGYYFYGVTRSVLDIGVGSTVQGGAAYDAYTYNNVAQGTAPNQKNAVGLYVVGVNAVNNAATWGLNTACDDNTTNGAATLSGRKCIGYEADFEVNGSSTIEGAAFIIQGAGTQANANGVQLSRAAGSTAYWNYGFITDDGAVVNALNVGAFATAGSNVGSQFVNLNYRDGSGNAQTLQLRSINSGLNVSSSAANDYLYLNAATSNPIVGVEGTSTNINLNLNPKGTGQVLANGSGGFATDTGPITSGSSITSATFAKVTPTTFATGLGGSSSCSDKGRIWAVTDGAGAIAWGANIAGGGSTYYTINCNGSNWTVMGK